MTVIRISSKHNKSEMKLGKIEKVCVIHSYKQVIGHGNEIVLLTLYITAWIILIKVNGPIWKSLRLKESNFPLLFVWGEIPLDSFGLLPLRGHASVSLFYA